MRAQAHEFKAVGVGLAVDENEVGPYMAVAAIVPFTGQWVIEIPARQRCVGGQQVHDLGLQQYF